MEDITKDLVIVDMDTKDLEAVTTEDMDPIDLAEAHMEDMNNADLEAVTTEDMDPIDLAEAHMEDMNNADLAEAHMKDMDKMASELVIFSIAL
jgi:hypothetical protein